MNRVLAVILGGLALGSAMATGALDWPLRPGWVGLVAMVLFALAARQRWLGLKLAAPGSPERGLWIGLGGSAVLCGHLTTALAIIGPTMELHSRAGHALGADNWTLVLGAALAWAIARDAHARSDERDAQVAALGLRWGHYVLSGLLLVFIVMLGFGIGETMRRLSHPMIAHLLIVALMVCWLVDHAVRLRAYRQDAALDEDTT